MLIWAGKGIWAVVMPVFLWMIDESLRRMVHKGTTKIERHHKFSKHLAFGSGGHLRSNNPADQEKADVYNELVTNAVALQTVMDQPQALHTLKSNGLNIRTSDLAFLLPYATSKLKRFGDYPTDLKPKAMPICTALRNSIRLMWQVFTRILPTVLSDTAISQIRQLTSHGALALTSRLTHVHCQHLSPPMFLQHHGVVVHNLL